MATLPPNTAAIFSLTVELPSAGGLAGFCAGATHNIFLSLINSLLCSPVHTGFSLPLRTPQLFHGDPPRRKTTPPATRCGICVYCRSANSFTSNSV